MLSGYGAFGFGSCATDIRGRQHGFSVGWQRSSPGATAREQAGRRRAAGHGGAAAAATSTAGRRAQAGAHTAFAASPWTGSDTAGAGRRARASCSAPTARARAVARTPGGGQAHTR